MIILGPPSALAESRRHANVRFQLRPHSGVVVGSVYFSKYCCVALEGVVRLSKQPLTFKAVCVHISFSNLRQKPVKCTVGTPSKTSKAVYRPRKAFSFNARFRHTKVPA